MNTWHGTHLKWVRAARLLVEHETEVGGVKQMSKDIPIQLLGKVARVLHPRGTFLASPFFSEAVVEICDVAAAFVEVDWCIITCQNQEPLMLRSRARAAATNLPN